MNQLNQRYIDRSKPCKVSLMNNEYLKTLITYRIIQFMNTKFQERVYQSYTHLYFSLS